MGSNAKAVSTKVVGALSLGTRVVKVGYVDKTDIWKRVHLSPGVQKKFEETAEKNLSSLRTDTDLIALQETPHESEKDNRTHFTAVEIDNKGTVVAKRHFPVQ